jgi:hypothetical protein
MPRILTAEDIPMKVRRPHLNRYKSQLRDALNHPGLTAEQRVSIKEKLANLGKTKPYAALAAQRRERERSYAEERGLPVPEPRTKVIAKSSTVGETREDLLGQTKAELIATVEKEGVVASRSWAKARIVDAILESRGGR